MDAAAQTHMYLRGRGWGKAAATSTWAAALELEAQADALDDSGNPLLAQVYRLEADRLRASLRAA